MRTPITRRAYGARGIAARVGGRPAPAPFRYRRLGMMGTIGRKSAVADFGMFRLRGFVAWLLWGLVHVCYRFPQSDRRDAGLALGIPDLRARRAADYRPRNLTAGPVGDGQF